MESSDKSSGVVQMQPDAVAITPGAPGGRSSTVAAGRVLRRLRGTMELPQLPVIVLRVAVVVGGALAVKAVADNVGQGPAYWLTAVFAGAVLIVFHTVQAVDKRRWAYALYAATMVGGAVLYLWKGVSVDIGMSGPVALYTSLGLFFTGLAGITKRLRIWAPALKVGGAVLAVSLVAGWFGLTLYERAAEPLLFLAALLGLYVGVTLMSGGLLTRGRQRTNDSIGDSYLAGRVMGALPLWGRRVLPFVLAAAIFGFGVLLVTSHRLDVSVVIWGTLIFLFVLLLVVSHGVADTALLLSVASLVFSLSASSEPYDSAKPAVAPVAPGDTTLIALGDSFISGEGADSFYAETNVRGQNECRRSPTAYAPLLLDETEFVPDAPFDSLIFIACSGAKARDLYYLPQYPNDPIGGPSRLRANGLWTRGATQLEQLDQRLRADQPKLGMVLLSLGGNDAGFGKIISTCIGLGNCATVVDKWTDELADIKPGLRASFTDLRRVVGKNVPVVVIPYPIPLSRSRCDESVLFAAEHARLYDFVVELNDTIAEVATQAAIGFTVLGRSGDNDEAFQSQFDNRRVCDSGPDGPAVNYLGVNPIAGAVRDRANPRNWLHNSFHPNEAGHAIIARQVRDWINEQTSRNTWVFELPTDGYRPRPDLAVREMQLEQAEVAAVEAADSGDSCPVTGPDWEPAWAACENGRSLQRFYLWALGATGAAFLFVLVLIVQLRDVRAWLSTKNGPSPDGRLGNG